MCDALKGKREKNWINLGGQLIPEQQVDQIRSDIVSGKLSNWDKSITGIILFGKNTRLRNKSMHLPRFANTWIR